MTVDDLLGKGHGLVQSVGGGGVVVVGSVLSRKRSKQGQDEGISESWRWNTYGTQENNKQTQRETGWLVSFWSLLLYVFLPSLSLLFSSLQYPCCLLLVVVVVVVVVVGSE